MADTTNSSNNLLEMDQIEEDRISKTFKGRTLFITGGTGFLGKVLVEKLLRRSPDIKKIYLLIRPKKGKDPQLRIKEMFENPLFDSVKKQRNVEALLKQCQAISGDVILSDLGISNEDRELLAEEVSIVYHCAATIRFDEELKKAVLINARGTKLMLDLARKLKKLEFFAYVSTAYCHLHVEHLYEKPYDPPANPHKVITAVEWLENDILNSITKKILGNIPNTYAYTKSLAENLVVETFNELPTCILRPSIVIPIWKEPIPGWTDNINGPTGLLIGAGKGVLRSMYCNSSRYGDYLPVDIAVNGIIVSSWNYIENKDTPTKIVHMTSSNEIQVSWQEIIEIGRWVVENRVPLNGVAWYPGGSMKSNKLLHQICVLLFHWVPAILVDMLIWCLGYPPVLCRVQRRITKGFEVFEYYANNQWRFDNEKAVTIRGRMNNVERANYIVEKIDLNLIEYFENCILCARRYILKETDDTIPAARRHMRIMWCVDKICKLLFFGLLLYIIGNYIFKKFAYVNDSPVSYMQKLDA